MSKQIDRILLIILWLLAATLGACFWFNALFGFNIFSAQHWEYISYLQAAQQSIRTSFYISLILASVIILAGLYILMRPQFHGLHLRLPRIKISFAHADKKPATQDKPNAARPNVSTTIADSTPVAQAAPTAAPQSTPPSQAAPSAPRPPRLSVPRTAMQPATTANTSAPTGPTPAQTAAATRAALDEKIKEIQQIFKDTGYTTKPAKKIASLYPSLIAIGTDEQLWLGGIDATPADLNTAMEKLSNVFSDTLDDIEINITGFIVGNVPDAPTDILIFADTNELREYMANNANPPLPDDDNGNFDAYSEYIDTVLNYVDKI